MVYKLLSAKKSSEKQRRRVRTFSDIAIIFQFESLNAFLRELKHIKFKEKYIGTK